MGLIGFSVFVIGTLLFIFSSSGNRLYVRQKWYSFSRFRVNWQSKLARQKTEQRLRELGFPISMYYFQVIRYAFLLVVGVLWIGISSTLRFHEVQWIPLISVVLVFLMSLPREKILGIKTPFAYFMSFLEKVQRERYGNELYLLMNQMKNSFQVYGESAPSAIAIIEELLSYTETLKPVMRRFISYWYSNDKEAAVAYFSSKIGTSESKKLAQLLVKLDDLKPNELINQLEGHINVYREIRDTNRQRRDENISSVVFLGAVLSVFVILINFITVSIIVDFLNQSSSLLM
ncbi:hypothetical protein LAV72_18685 [Lysinibacillus xylanilyticus]|uniref:hypothetical protein n=1 Tax=Lysinibacillus xylanilyticus TaxID=582475 RepID=UPI002B24E83C|nr:hypothetical protein [Lysinibacillus xylanilyticus]MEB2301634.1 hypothetical protein [Lysinibacillus xylanilyticus]